MSDSLVDVWDQVLTSVQFRIAQPIFEQWLKDTDLLSWDDGCMTIGVKDKPAQEWIENRLSRHLQEAVKSVTNMEVELNVVVQPRHPVTDNASNGLSREVLTEDLFSEPDFNQSFAQETDFETLWNRSGFTQIPDYALKFWRIYLGRAFDLWEFLISEDKRNVKEMKKGSISYWTPPKKYSYRRLSSVLRCSRKTLTGRLVPCWLYEKSKREAKLNGKPPPAPECCGKYPEHKLHQSKEGEYFCVHWLEGLMERLNKEGLLAVQETRQPGKPRSHELQLQAWRLLPVLTPKQVAKFKNEIDRIHHRHWLEKYGHHGKFDVPTWEKIDAPTLVPLLENYGSGRELFDTYNHNPLTR